MCIEFKFCWLSSLNYQSHYLKHRKPSNKVRAHANFSLLKDVSCNLEGDCLWNLLKVIEDINSFLTLKESLKLKL